LPTLALVLPPQRVFREKILAHLPISIFWMHFCQHLSDLEQKEDINFGVLARNTFTCGGLSTIHPGTFPLAPDSEITVLLRCQRWHLYYHPNGCFVKKYWPTCPFPSFRPSREGAVATMDLVVQPYLRAKAEVD